MNSMRVGLAALFLTTATLAAFGQAAAGAIDGRIAENEYPGRAQFDEGRYEVFWRLDDDGTAAIGLRAGTPGWVALGLAGGPAMTDADMVIGWVLEDGTAQAADVWSTGPIGPHPPDTELGGADHLSAVAGTERDGVTVLEFTRPLATGDPYDREFPREGTLEIIWAYGDTDDFNAYHATAGAGTLDMAAGAAGPASAAPGRSSLVLVHALLMSASFVAMLTGVTIARRRQKIRGWLNHHRPLGVAGAVLGVLGLATAVYMIAATTGVHLRVLHAWLGLGTIVVTVATPLLGQSFLKLKKGKPVYRRLHRWAGWLTLALMLVVIVLGLIQAGVL